MLCFIVDVWVGLGSDINVTSSGLRSAQPSQSQSQLTASYSPALLVGRYYFNNRLLSPQSRLQANDNKDFLCNFKYFLSLGFLIVIQVGVIEGRPRNTMFSWILKRLFIRFNEFISERCVFRYTVLVLLILNAFNKIKCLVTYKCLS